MEINNSTIIDVTTGFNYLNKLSVSLTIGTSIYSCSCCFYFENPVDLQRLKKLMAYAEVREITELKGKRIRTVFLDNTLLLGFGHPTSDSFFLLSSKTFQEFTKFELNKLLSTR